MRKEKNNGTGDLSTKFEVKKGTVTTFFRKEANGARTASDTGLRRGIQKRRGP